jgi:hypothetical protein
LQEDHDNLNQLIGEEARGFMNRLRYARMAQGTKPKYPFIWHIDRIQFSFGQVKEKRPIFYFYATVQEINCMIKDYQALKKLEEEVYKNGIPPELLETFKNVTVEEDEDPTQEKIVDGGDDQLIQRTIVFGLTPHDDPNIEEYGHNWKVVEFMFAGENALLA